MLHSSQSELSISEDNHHCRCMFSTIVSYVQHHCLRCWAP